MFKGLRTLFTCLVSWVVYILYMSGFIGQDFKWARVNPNPIELAYINNPPNTTWLT